ncbi:MAG TPA: LCP family protein [Mycobacteriales bacterium]|nr:LCP family protein [Mycobacteriales bacterium]
MSRGAHAASRERPPTLPRGRHAAPPAPRVSPDPESAERPAVPAPEILAPGRPAWRRPSTAVLAAVVLLIALVTGGAVYGLGGGSGDGTGGPAGPQSTLLLQFRDGDGAAASVLYGVGSGSGAAVLLPSRLIATVPGAGQQQFGPVLALHDGAELSRSTVSDLLGVRIDAQWVLDRAGLVAAVDAVGGVVADVDTDVVSGRTVLVQAGKGRPLDGARAAAYLLDRPADQDDIQYQPRVQRVFQSLLTRLAERPGALAGLPRGARPAAAAGTVLGSLAKASADAAVLYQTLPVTEIDTDGVATYTLDVAAVDELVAGRFSGAALPGRDERGNRVLVVNAVGTPGLGETVRNRIVPAGFTFVGSRNQTPFGRAETVVVVFDSDQATVGRARALARAMGLPEAQVQVSERGQSIADLMVVVGKDFRA